jgi:WD40 repeat protein
MGSIFHVRSMFYAPISTLPIVYTVSTLTPVPPAFPFLPQWDLDSGTCTTTLPNAHELNITGLAVNPTNPSVAFSGSRDYSVKTWDLERGLLSTYTDKRNVVTALSVCAATPHTLYQGSEDLRVRVWDTRLPSHSAPATTVGGFVYFPVSMDVHPGGVLLATGCKGFDSVGCTVKVWDLRATSKPLFDFAGHSQDVVGCRFSESGDSGVLFSASKDGSLCAWDLGTSHTDTDTQSAHTGGPKAHGHLPLARNHATGKLITCLAVPVPGTYGEPGTSGTSGESGNEESGTSGTSGESGESGTSGESGNMAFGANDGSVSLARLVSRGGSRSIEVYSATAPWYDPES